MTQTETDSTVTAPSDPAIEAAIARGEKPCVSCGKDLRGHRRYKTPRGYLCHACEKLDRTRRLPCAECGKPTLPENLRPWGTVSICPACHADHEADPTKRRLKKVSTRRFEAEDVQKTIVIAIVVVALLLVVGFVMM